MEAPGQPGFLPTGGSRSLFSAIPRSLEEASCHGSPMAPVFWPQRSCFGFECQIRQALYRQHHYAIAKTLVEKKADVVAVHLEATSFSLENQAQEALADPVPSRRFQILQGKRHQRLALPPRATRRLCYRRPPSHWQDSSSPRTVGFREPTHQRPVISGRTPQCLSIAQSDFAWEQPWERPCCSAAPASISLMPSRS